MAQEDGIPSSSASKEPSGTIAPLQPGQGLSAAHVTLVAPKDGSISTRLEHLTVHNGTIENPTSVDVTSHRLMPGDVIGHYRVLEHLGSGGMGYLHRARDERLERDVAIKLAFDSMATDSGAILREARALAALNHPNVVTIHEVGVHQDCTYIVMELLRGETLRARIDRAPIPLLEALALAGDIIRGLSASHQANLVHLDVKPENIFITKEGPAKLIDYGVARQRRTGAYEGENIVGTIAYMAPEQLIGEKLDYRADIFSFGIILHELVTGKHPFMRAQLSATMHALVTGDFFNDEQVVDPLVDVIVRKCMQLEPSERPANAAQVLEELERVVRVRSQIVSNTIPVAPPPEVVVSRGPLYLAAALALVVLGGGFFYASEKTSPATPITTPSASAMPPKASYTLTLESQPSGASVHEDTHELGKTPLTIPLQSEATGPRTFTLSLDGYSTYSFHQEPAAANVHFIAQLSKVEIPPVSSSTPDSAPSALASAQKKQLVAKSQPTGTSTPTNTAATTARPAGTLDIKLKR